MSLRSPLHQLRLSKEILFFVFPGPSESLALHSAATRLHTAMWRQDLTSRLRDVDGCDGFKYLPATAVSDLGLQELGYGPFFMLVREEYRFIFDNLEGRQDNSGGIVVTGHPGIGTDSLQKDNFAHVLVTSRQIGVFILPTSPPPKQRADRCATTRK